MPPDKDKKAEELSQFNQVLKKILEHKHKKKTKKHESDNTKKSQEKLFPDS